MKKQIAITLACVLIGGIGSLIVRYLLFTGSYIAFFESFEPLSGGPVVMTFAGNGAGTLKHAPGAFKEFAYTRTDHRVVVDLPPYNDHLNRYLFEIRGRRLIPQGQLLRGGSTTTTFGYGFCMNKDYHKIPF
jgi:hypothetical protein